MYTLVYKINTLFDENRVKMIAVQKRICYSVTIMKENRVNHLNEVSK